MNNRLLIIIGTLVLAVGVAAMILVWPRKNSYQELSHPPAAAIQSVATDAPVVDKTTPPEIISDAFVASENEITAPVTVAPVAKTAISDVAINTDASAKLLPDTSKLVLYVGDGCGHCLKVKEYLKGVASLSGRITMKEVFQDQANATEMQTRAGECGLPIDRIGVPFLSTGDKCLIGDVDVIAYFKGISGQVD